MLAKRIIPCLDVDAGRVVKGVRFRDLRDAGDPVELAARYDADGADELVFLDITATVEGRDATDDVIARTAEQVFIPLTVGGGVRERRRRPAAASRRRRQGRVEQRRGARPGPALALRRHLRRAVRRDRDRRRPAQRSGWEVFVDAGRTPTGRDAVEWAAEATAERGAGEVCSPRWTATAPATATTSSCSRRSRRDERAADRERRRRDARSTSPTGCAWPTRSWPRAGSTTAT